MYNFASVYNQNSNELKNENINNNPIKIGCIEITR